MQCEDRMWMHLLSSQNLKDALLFFVCALTKISYMDTLSRWFLVICSCDMMCSTLIVYFAILLTACPFLKLIYV